MTTDTIIDPVTYQHNRTIARVVVVGAGGIGARLVPVLTKLVPPGTRLDVIDPDVVEPRNVLRQPFLASDVGRPKADVMQRRYGSATVPVYGHVAPVEDRRIQGLLRDADLVIGCVDRRAPRAWMLAHANVYLDAGCDGTASQVLLTTPTVAGWLAAPDLFVDSLDADEPADGCGQQGDTQTVVANQIAATWVAQCVHMMLARVPIGWCGAKCSALGPHTLVRLIRVGRGIMAPDVPLVRALGADMSGWVTIAYRDARTAHDLAVSAAAS